MWKLLKNLFIVGLLGGVAYVGYDYYNAGLHNRPQMPDGAFSLSFKTGIRAIVIGPPDERQTRRYFGFPADVPFYIKEAWAHCRPPEDTERKIASDFLETRNMPGERFEVICKVTADNDVVVTGYVTSVPKL